MRTLLILIALVASLLTTATSYAAKGNSSGGGGDATEERVNEIRSDILKWITNYGAKGLTLPIGISIGEYESKMISILQPKKVVIGFVEKDDEKNDELKVNVNGTPKTCRGFISDIDSQAHILCNISRFKNTSESEQYKLIHHEYAGLVDLEKNKGAASDYEISSQITDFLEAEVVLRLAVKPRALAGKSTIACDFWPGGYDHETITLRMNGKKVESMEYESYQGHVGPFKKVSDFDFQYTNKILAINHIVSISEDLKNAVLTVVYKEGGNILSSNYFTCY